MIVFDIDDTISPTRPPKDWAVEHETVRVGYVLKMPTYVTEFLRSRDDIALLSTWGESAKNVAEGFGFNAKILVMEEMSGVAGKFEVIQSLGSQVTAWVDDHMKPAMKRQLTEAGILAIKPTGGVISKRQIQQLASL